LSSGPVNPKQRPAFVLVLHGFACPPVPPAKEPVQSVERCPAAAGVGHEPLLRAKTLLGLIPKTGFFALATEPVFLKLDVFSGNGDENEDKTCTIMNRATGAATG
jgi:hypothetical protein